MITYPKIIDTAFLSVCSKAAHTQKSEFPKILG
jgi:hypothetical protein